jgi:hypothetical protein
MKIKYHNGEEIEGELQHYCLKTPAGLILDIPPALVADVDLDGSSPATLWDWIKPVVYSMTMTVVQMTIAVTIFGERVSYVNIIFLMCLNQLMYSYDPTDK